MTIALFAVSQALILTALALAYMVRRALRQAYDQGYEEALQDMSQGQIMSLDGFADPPGQFRTDH